MKGNKRVGTALLVSVLLLGVPAWGLQVALDDDFDDGVVDTNLWSIGGDPGEVWESGSTLYLDDVNTSAPRPYVVSRADNGYAWSAGTAQLWWDSGGRYAGMMTDIGGGNFLLVRKDITGGYWTLSVNGTNHTIWSIGAGDNWYWEIAFDNGAGTVEFRGKQYSSTGWDIVQSYSYTNSDPLTLQVHSYNTDAQIGRMRVTVPNPPNFADLFDDFDDGIVDQTLWNVTGDVMESGTILRMNYNAIPGDPNTYVASSVWSTQDYRWTEGRAKFERKSDGRYAGLMAGSNYILYRGDIVGGYWTIDVKNGTELTRYTDHSAGSTGEWDWMIDFSDHHVVVQGWKVGDPQPAITWSLSDPNKIPAGPFSVGAATYGNADAEYDSIGFTRFVAPNTNYLDDDFDDGVVGSEWDAINASESGSTLTLGYDPNNGITQASVWSTIGYRWTEGQAIIDWTDGGRYAGLVTGPGGGDWIFIRRDVVGGHWVLQINKAGQTVVQVDFGWVVGPCRWIIDWDPNHIDVEGINEGYENASYSWSSTDPNEIPQGPFRLGAASYNAEGRFDRLAVVQYVPVCGDLWHPYPVGDLDRDCYVNWSDFSVFASQWLMCTDPNDPQCTPSNP